MKARILSEYWGSAPNEWFSSSFTDEEVEKILNEEIEVWFCSPHGVCVIKKFYPDKEFPSQGVYDFFLQDWFDLEDFPLDCEIFDERSRETYTRAQIEEIIKKEEEEEEKKRVKKVSEWAQDTEEVLF